jgi:hypothetical protein
MTAFARLRSVAAALFRRARFEDSMRDELRFHLDTYTDDLIRSGVCCRGRRATRGGPLMSQPSTLASPVCGACSSSEWAHCQESSWRRPAR